MADRLKQDLQARVDIAGLEILEVRITHLSYAPEIAAAMLQRQQAEAIIAARQKIVEGAVGMVEMALNNLSKKQRRRAGRGTQGGNGQQSAGGPLRQPRRPADCKQRIDLLMKETTTGTGEAHGKQGQREKTGASAAVPRPCGVIWPPGRRTIPLHQRPDRISADRMRQAAQEVGRRQRGIAKDINACRSR